jgi:hypothetical protein
MDHRFPRPVGEWLGASFVRLKDRWLTLTLLFVFGCCAVLAGVVMVYVLGVAFVGFVQGWENLGRVVSDPRRLQYFFEEAKGGFLILNVLAAFVALRLYCWILVASIHASADASLGFRGALRKGKGHGYAFLVLFLVQQTLVQIGALLFILPGIALAVWLGFAFWAFARDGAGAFESLGRSARTVRGNFWGVFGRMLLLGLIGGALMIVPVVGWLVGAAWIFVAWSLLYEDLRRPSPAARPGRGSRSRRWGCWSWTRPTAREAVRSSAPPSPCRSCCAVR